MAIVGKRVSQIAQRDYQRILGMSFMHGARRRLDEKLAEVCRGFPYRAITIDAFAMSLVNRWRLSLGYNKPLSALSGEDEIVEGLFEIHLSFDRIRREATKLVSSNTIGKLIGSSFPLIIVDEFQDCQDSQLEFVQGLVPHTQLILAADEFQLLNSAANGCPAVEWILDLERNGNAIVEDLHSPWRTNKPGLLNAARALRENVGASCPTIPVVCCPSFGPVAWWIISKMALPPYPWKGSSAVISPTINDPLVKRTLASCQAQLERKQRAAIHFRIEKSHESEMQSLAEALRIKGHGSVRTWSAKNTSPSAIEIQVTDEVQHYCRLRGLSSPTEVLVMNFAERAVNAKRAYAKSTAKRVVSTVHGAKNREFENVFVLWNPNIVGNWSGEEQRRLLYNAVTRAKQNCIVLFIGSEEKARTNPVVGLLGSTQPAFPPKKKSRSEQVRAGVNQHNF